MKRKKAEVNSENGRKKLSSVLKNNKHLKLQILKLEPPDLLKISGVLSFLLEAFFLHKMSITSCIVTWFI